PPSERPAPTHPGHLSADAIATVMTAHDHELRVCHRSALATEPELGHVEPVLSIVVEADGHVSSVAIEKPGAASPALAGCIAANVLRWQFPAPEGGATQLSQPFRFDPPPPSGIVLAD